MKCIINLIEVYDEFKTKAFGTKENLRYALNYLSEHKFLKEDIHFNFTKRIKYVNDEFGEFKYMCFEVEIYDVPLPPSPTRAIKRLFLNSKIPDTIDVKMWVKEHAIILKPCTIETIYTC